MVSMITERAINQNSQTARTATHDAPWSFLLCLKNIGLAQFENQNVSRPNHNFVTLSLILKNFSMPKFNVLLLVLLSLFHM